MATITSYNSLIQQIERHSKREDIADELDGFVRLAEIRIDTSLQLRTNEVRSTLVLNTDDRFCVLPTGFLEMRALRILDSGRYYDLEFVSPEQMSYFLKPNTSAMMPHFYTINSRVELDTIPDQNYTLEMTYFKEMTPLTEDNQVNEVILKYPNLYLYACLTEVFLWARDADEANNYLMQFDMAIKQARFEQRRGRYGPAPRMRHSGPTP